MNLALATKAVLEELTRMRSDGVSRIYIENETLLALERNLRPEAYSNDVAEMQVTDVRSEQNIPHANDLVVKEPPPLRSKEPKVEKEKKTFLPAPPDFEIPKGSKQIQWEWLKQKVLDCETCKSELNPDGKIVFGEGDLDADIFLCGEAPGADEETAGVPFVGPAGDLLMKILAAMGLNRDKVYIGNILTWRPRHTKAYGNRPPTLEEMNFCLPYLKAQLEIVKPKVVMALGKTATDGLLGHDPKRRLSQVRGNWHEVMGFPIMVTYHPSYLLHNPSKTSKRRVWEDFLLVMERLKMPISEKQKGFFQ